MIIDKNNLHELDTFMFFKWFFKAWVAVFIVTHTFDITMAVFDVAQHVVSGAAGVISSDTSMDISSTISSRRLVSPLPPCLLSFKFLLPQQCIILFSICPKLYISVYKTQYLVAESFYILSRKAIDVNHQKIFSLKSQTL